LYWGDKLGDCNNSALAPAALEVVVISGTTANPIVTKSAYDPCDARRQTNHFSSVTISNKGTDISGLGTFYYNATQTHVNNGFFARIIPLYSNAVIGIVNVPDNPNQNYPTQGSVITSVGTSGNAQRRVNVFQGYPELPTELFLYNLFSP
jgi:hypothetical protein